jgi:hypothetical protein
MKRKKSDISTLKLTTHPLVAKLTSHDCLPLDIPSDLTVITQDELDVLLSNITLNVIATSQPHHYQLLVPDPVFELLSQHPAAKKMHVSILVHTVASQESLLHLLNTLLLMNSAFISHRFEANSENIHARYVRFKDQGFKPYALSLLANLAGRKRSVFRKVSR